MYFKHVFKSKPSYLSSLNISRNDEIPFIWARVLCVFQCSTQTPTLQLIQVIDVTVLQILHLFSFSTLNCESKSEILLSFNGDIAIKAAEYLFALGKLYVLNFFESLFYYICKRKYFV